MGNDVRGSNWRKWDLHVHTPASLQHNYSGTTDNAWERFISDLEKLPSEFKVLGINDYFFIDGYRRVQEEKRTGRLQNIDLILPVIELRIDKFGGTNSALSRVNLHIIFSDELEPDLIQSQFLNGLSRELLLSPTPTGKPLRWKGLLTKESMADLGQQIIDSIPPDQKNKYGSPLAEGFGSLNFALDTVQDLLTSHYFSERYLTAVGKTEWENIKWNDQSIADKKDIINRAHFVFTSASSYESFHTAKERLVLSRVNHRLLDCSDAHTYSDSQDKDRIGNCFTWIKADPTFEGLLHCWKNYEDRVFVGAVPDKLIAVRERPGKHIKSLSFKKSSESKLEETWFESVGEIRFNHGLVAIIGNKGNAKSALTDILGLLGNTANHNHFSFLASNKFRQQKGAKAKSFEATLSLESGQSFSKSLNDDVSLIEPEVLKYIPQNFFETICNEVGVTEGNFDKELEQVIFSHVAPVDRLEKTSLRALIDHKTSEINDAIAQLKVQIEAINTEIATKEEQISKEYRNQFQGKLNNIQQELEVHRQRQPQEVVAPNNTESDKTKREAKSQIAGNNEQIKQFDKQILEATETLSKLAKLETSLSKAENQVKNFNDQYTRAKKDFEKLGLENLSFEDIISLHINAQHISEQMSEVFNAKQEAQARLNPDDPESLLARKQLLQAETKVLQEKLAQPEKEYQAYLNELAKWKKKEKQLQNAPTNSIEYYKDILRNIELLPAKLSILEKERLELSLKIFAEIQRLTLTYKELYKPVQAFIQNHPLANKFVLNFDVSIEEMGFKEKFFDWISQGVTGSFCGKESGKHLLEELLHRSDFNTIEGVVKFLTDITFHLTHDVRQNSPTAISLATQLRREKHADDLYNFIFSLDYLKPRYVLKMGDKELYQLSPGEKGALLLVFYLLIDNDDVPLIIDQPEENLDNQTVFDLLVPSITEARKRRQIIIVTHNPNIAVVCDAEQIIYASIDKRAGNKVEYFTGATENREINKKLLDVLEGTSPAFVKRHSKYNPEHLIIEEP